MKTLTRVYRPEGASMWRWWVADAETMERDRRLHAVCIRHGLALTPPEPKLAYGWATTRMGARWAAWKARRAA